MEMKKKTELAKLLKALRIEHNERQIDMADRLKTPSSCLCAVETGKTNMPRKWLKVLETEYSLDKDKINQIKFAGDVLRDSIKIDMNGASEVKREVAVIFSKVFNNMDDDTARKIRELL